MNKKDPMKNVYVKFSTTTLNVNPGLIENQYNARIKYKQDEMDEILKRRIWFGKKMMNLWPDILRLQRHQKYIEELKEEAGTHGIVIW